MDAMNVSLGNMLQTPSGAINGIVNLLFRVYLSPGTIPDLIKSNYSSGNILNVGVQVGYFIKAFLNTNVQSVVNTFPTNPDGSQGTPQANY